MSRSRTSYARKDTSSLAYNAATVFLIAFVGIMGLFMLIGGILTASNPSTPLEDAQTDCHYQGLVYDEASGECR